jgi:hypothetical protein
MPTLLRILTPQWASQSKRRITSASLISWAKKMPRKSNLPGISVEQNFYNQLVITYRI